jgi:hypothetical protein
MADSRTRAPVVSPLLVALALLSGSLGLATAGPVAAAGADVPVADEVRAELARSGQASFWVRFESRSDLSRASARPDWADRGRAVVSELQRNADGSQAAVRALLTGKGVEFTSFWVVNAIKVTAGADVLDLLVKQPGVAEITVDRIEKGPAPSPAANAAAEQEQVQAVGWNLDRVRAPEVWNGFGVRGEGIVVANIGRGVPVDHPALVNSYRGNRGDGTFDHNYNYFTRDCGWPGPLCFGSEFEMGIAVGDDGGANQIGVAPGAKWISANPCDAFSCGLEPTIAAGQWLLAPTDLARQNPRPDLRPNVIISGELSSGAPMYREMIEAWVAAGMFPALTTYGSDGRCGVDVGSPAFTGNYVTGAFDVNGNIYGSSPRGPALDGSVKPDIAAPGVAIRSSYGADGYETSSGSSTAPPHVAGAVALMWSTAPALVGDVETTMALLGQTAEDRSDLSCGGEPGFNNVWGEGALDAYRAVEQSPREVAGTLAGVVTDAATGAPVAGARLEMHGPSNRSVVTDAEGAYEVNVPVGDYEIEVTAYGYAPATAEATVTEGTTARLDVVLTPFARYPVSGTVRDEFDAPVSDVTVTLLGTPFPPVVTGADGTFSYPDVAVGEYQIQTSEVRCSAEHLQTLVVDGDETVDVVPARRSDGFGYTCHHVPADYVEADTALPGGPVELPFTFWLYDHSFTTATVVGDGLSFPVDPGRFAGITVFGADMVLDDQSSVRTTVVGAAPDRQFIVEWRDVGFYLYPDLRVSYEVKLHENGDIETQYRDIDDSPEERTARVSISGPFDDQLSYSVFQPLLYTGLGIRYVMPRAGFVEGRVTDVADGSPLADVVVRALEDGTEVRSTTTAADGTYRMRVPLGTYTVEASLNGQGTDTGTVVVDEPEETVVADFELAFAVVRVEPTSLDFNVPPGETRTKTMVVHNDGVAPLEFEIELTEPWASAEPSIGTVAPGGSQEVTVTVDSAGLAAGSYNAAGVVRTNDPRTPEVLTSVSLLVPAYQVAVDVGATSPYTDAAGDVWGADRRYTAGSWGYTNPRSSPLRTNRAISGTEEDLLFQTARGNPVEYRFDGVPNGVYVVELEFAEINGRRPNRRLADIIIEEALVLPAHDISRHVGTFAADVHELVAVVEDGELSVRFVERTGFGVPIVSALRVTHTF